MGESFYRVDRKALCPDCLKPYGDHPRERYYIDLGEEVDFHRTCAGDLVKT